MEAFLDQLQIILPVLGVNAIRVRKAAPAWATAAPDSPVFTLTNKKHNVEARAQQIGDEFMLLEGSQVVAVWAGTGKAESTERSYASYTCAAPKAHVRRLDPGARRYRDPHPGHPLRLAFDGCSGRPRPVEQRPPRVEVRRRDLLRATGRTAGWSEAGPPFHCALKMVGK